MKTTMKPISAFVPITRIDEEKRIVYGIAFANEVVAGDKLRLSAGSMERATPDYMQWGTVRAMHQPSAAGTAVPLDPELARECGVTWFDDAASGKRVAQLASYISDDGDWKKVTDGTYKGYSVGVMPRVLRGNVVEECTWIETSLVDRPKDPDALLSTFRAEEIPEEGEVEIKRASFAEYLEGCAPSALRDMALDFLWNSLWDIQYSEGTPEEKSAAIEQTCAEFAQFMIGALATGDIPNIVEPDAGADDAERSVGTPLLTRFLALEVENMELSAKGTETPFPKEEIERLNEVVLARTPEGGVPSVSVLLNDLEGLTRATETISTLTLERDNSQAELTRVQGLADENLQRAETAEERVKQMENEPARTAPVRFYRGVERIWERGGEPESNDPEIETMREELKRLSDEPPSEDSKIQEQRASKISVLKRSITIAEGGG